MRKLLSSEGMELLLTLSGMTDPESPFPVAPVTLRVFKHDGLFYYSNSEKDVFGGTTVTGQPYELSTIKPFNHNRRARQAVPDTLTREERRAWIKTLNHVLTVNGWEY